MIDLEKPFQWKQAKQAMSSPLGVSIQASSPDVPQGVSGPSEPGLGTQVANKVAMSAVDNGLKNFQKGVDAIDAGRVASAITTEGTGAVASEAGSQAAMLASQMQGMGSEAVAKTAEAAGTTSGMASAAGPLAAGIGGVIEGDYGKAAGAAAGSALGAAAGSVVPVVGTYIGGMLGSYLGGQMGSGFKNGTTNVGGK